MDKYLHPLKSWEEITYPFPSFSGATVGIWEWISNFIRHFAVYVITHLCWDSMLVKGGPGCQRTQFWTEFLFIDSQNIIQLSPVTVAISFCNFAIYASYGCWKCHIKNLFSRIYHNNVCLFVSLPCHFWLFSDSFYLTMKAYRTQHMTFQLSN